MALLDVEFKLERTINELDYSKKIKDSNKIERLNKEKIDYTLKLEYIKKIINKEF